MVKNLDQFFQRLSQFFAIFQSVGYFLLFRMNVALEEVLSVPDVAHSQLSIFDTVFNFFGKRTGETRSPSPAYPQVKSTSLAP